MSESRLDESVWSTAFTFDRFIAQVQKYSDLWNVTRDTASVDDSAREAVAQITVPLRLLVLLEDWCRDATHTIPYIARLIECNPLIEMRLVLRDQNDTIMDAHLSDGARSIPVLIVLDETGVERGWWGPRPAPLQAWAMGEGATLEPVERYTQIRTWLAHDKGATAVSEVLSLLQRTADMGA